MLVHEGAGQKQDRYITLEYKVIAQMQTGSRAGPVVEVRGAKGRAQMQEIFI